MHAQIQQHTATVHHSEPKVRSQFVIPGVPGSSVSSVQPVPPPPPRPPHHHHQMQRLCGQQQGQSSRGHHHHHHHHHHQHHRPNQTQSFDDSHLQYHSKSSRIAQTELYGGSQPATTTTTSSHSQSRRRHSSTSRLKSTGGKNPSNFITSITNNFMSFGAPFLFDWRLFCERGQPRYVHKHDGDGLRVDECEARFLNKIAVEEKASLNAISDDEDHSTSIRHQQRKNKSGSAAANVECLGSVRKSGFLSVKKWLIRKKNSLELARKRGWKGYWVCLKGTTLLFYRCDCEDNKSGGHVIEARPRHLIFVDACLVQAIPEHPKRDFVFCLSTAFGDAYLLDAPCLVERDHWIAAIHCACAAQLARSSGRATVSHVLHKEIKRLDESVELDLRARTEAEQIISTALAAGSLTAAEAKAKQQQLLNQIHNLEEKVEKNRTEIFRFKAYLAALVNEEDPNPKTLLSQTTKRSKMQLNRLGVFTVSSLHAFNCAKNPTIIGNLTRSRSSEDNLCANHHHQHHLVYEHGGKSTPSVVKEVRIALVVKMLNGELHKLEFNATLSADQVLSKLLPSPIARDYYLRRIEDPSVIFKRHETILNHANETLEIVPKIMFTCEMSRDSNETLFGFSVESELCQEDLRVYVSRVETNSLAAFQSLRRSDEIVVINGAFVQDLDMMYVESVLQEELALCLTIRAARDESSASRPNSGCNSSSSWPGKSASVDVVDIATTDDLIESLVCPPPPPIDASQMILSEKQLSKYIVPKVDSYLLSPEAKHCHRSFEKTTRSLSTKSKKCDLLVRPHSAAASFQRGPGGHHHHHHHHHGHHGHHRNTIGGSTGHHHHHHHHHHHSSTKHIYHITDPQANLYGLLEQHMIPTGYETKEPTSGLAEQSPTGEQLPPEEQQPLEPEVKEVTFEAQTQVTPTVETGETTGPEMLTTKSVFGELSNEKLRKVIRELLDTEITYCQALDQLMTLYLDPLLKSCTLTNMDARRLIGSIPSVIITQNQFREDLTTIINNDELNIEGIAKCFLNYCNDFKSYSTFCVSHAKAIKLLADEKSILHDWLVKQSKSAKHPNMYSLESYLIRPIQRILKYPLLLSQIKTICPKDSQPYYKINESLRAIENVAEHINEMQRINEEYGTIFESLVASTKVNSKKNPLYLFDLTPISLLHYGGVDWINSVEFLGKSFRKSTSSSGGIHLHSMCFVFKQCVVFLCKETIRHGKSKKQSAATSDMEIIRHQVLIPVSEVQVRACPQAELELDFKWELIQLKANAQAKRSEKIFRLSNSTNEYRNAFLRTIRQIIREDVRRMSIMSARQVSTRSETSPTAKKSSDKRPMVSFASTQNLTRCGYCGEDFTKMVKKNG